MLIAMTSYYINCTVTADKIQALVSKFSLSPIRLFSELLLLLLQRRRRQAAAAAAATTTTNNNNNNNNNNNDNNNNNNISNYKNNVNSCPRSRTKAKQCLRLQSEYMYHLQYLQVVLSTEPWIVFKFLQCTYLFALQQQASR